MWKVPYFRHDLGKPEIESIAKVLQGPILTTGQFVRKFEAKFSSYMGQKHALGVTSCTGALHMALLALNIGPGDEVITTPMSFVATSTAILEAGATPVFVDVEDDTGNIDTTLIEAAITEKTKAIIPVHLYGLMCDMRHMKTIADRHGLYIIEDCAHCIEGERDGVRPGQLSEAACFSFYATKNLTCGEGGAIVTDHSDIYEKLRLLSHHGMTKTADDRIREGYIPWDMVSLGWKYNMSNIQAAMLLPQFDRMDEKLKNRRDLADRYDQLLNNIKGLRIPNSHNNSNHARHLYTVWIEDGRRDHILKSLQEMEIECVVNYAPIHLTSYFINEYGYAPRAFPIAEKIGIKTLSLPFYPGMSEDDAVIVANAISQSLNS
jgi:dTDP-4-amino-4,6-dideoxygalactose transaminase